MYNETNQLNPNTIPIRKPPMEVKTICPMPVIKEIFPTSLITLGERCKPTINKSKATPISEKKFIV